jgi:hypothetical protein
MAFDAKPSTWLGAGYALASHVLSANTNDASSNKTFPQLTDAEANPTTGDVRKLFYAICDQFYGSYNSTASADRPTRMSIVRSTTENASGQLVRSYTFQFTLDGSSLDVIAE